MSEHLVPELRFGEFNGDWSRELLEKCAVVGNGRDYKHLGPGPVPVFGTGGLITTVSDALSFKDAVGVGRKGTIDKPYVLRAPFWTVDTLFFVTPKAKVDTQFLFGNCLRIDWKSKAESTGVPSLSKTAIEQTMIAVTGIVEQRKVGTLLANVNATLSQHERKHRQLQQAKASLMQRMFPAVGASEPEIRFEGFAGEWAERKLTDEVDFFGGLTYSPRDVVAVPGVLVLRSSNVDASSIVLDDCVYVHPDAVNVDNVRPGDIVVVVRNGSRTLIGKHAIVKRSMPSTVIGAFMTGIRCDRPEFISALLSTSLFESEVSKSMGATINQITGGMFAKMRFLFPEAEEQEAIGSFFSKLDDLIETESQYVSKLQQVKSALLQKMFV